MAVRKGVTVPSRFQRPELATVIPFGYATTHARRQQREGPARGSDLPLFNTLRRLHASRPRHSRAMVILIERLLEQQPVPHGERVPHLRHINAPANVASAHLDHKMIEREVKRIGRPVDVIADSIEQLNPIQRAIVSRLIAGFLDPVA